MKKNWWMAASGLVLMGGLMVVALEGCDDDSDAEGLPAGFSDFDVHLDLMELAHLADVDHQGLYIDFGSPAQAKYTVGNWRTGWGSRVQQGGGSFAYVGQRGRVYFHVDEAGPLTIQLRLQALATQALTPYFNNEQLSSVTLPSESAFTEVSFQVPAQHVRAGENYLMLMFGGTMDVEGEPVSVAIDSMRVIPARLSPPVNSFRLPTRASPARLPSTGNPGPRC